ncbi:RNA polymerase sigma-70 factor (family 1) [Pedobacter africanus]|uniref:RNA polymerase sigma-70 factor (ECF subfamily) n=1 Tax=Pedobacter africanus TaxID=151894 RepID=A0ACC6KUL5_9SPHI|nr:sigma-70 family RNA polymerase sigma factor [Pedobacter africanus]MDR6782906.1 RNA polymerase sigma-70 factor (ECF subfamily) [Pedobacter africanus]
MKNHKLLSDEELFVLIKQDSQSAFSTLFDRYWKKMLVKASYLLRSDDGAEEVVLDAFANLWKRRHSTEIRNTMHTYIASAVKYEVFNKISDRKKRHPFIEDVKPAPVADDATRQWLDFTDLQQDLERAIAALPEKCRLVFKHRNDGMKGKEIAGLLKISQKTVEAHIEKALRTLREKFYRYIYYIFFQFN